MKILFTLFLTVLTSLSLADSRSFDRTWLGLFGKKNIQNSDYSIWSEAQARMDNDRFTNQQLLLRWGLLRKLSDTSEAGVIFGYIFQGPIKENRPTLQLSHTLMKSSDQLISIRHRFEYRKREDQKAVSGRYRAAVRYQSFLDSKNSLIIWDEPFINITREDWTGNRAVERNRLFLGAGIPWNGVNLEVGYMHQFTPRSERDSHEHILTMYLFY